MIRRVGNYSQSWASIIISSSSIHCHELTAAETRPCNPCTMRLHWLPVDVRIDFKVLLMVYKALHGLVPYYIRELLNDYQPTRQLRSSSHIMLHIPKTRTVRYGDRAKIQNMLPLNVRQSDTISCFKSRLKTHYFKLKYPYQSISVLMCFYYLFYYFVSITSIIFMLCIIFTLLSERF